MTADAIIWADQANGPKLQPHYLRHWGWVALAVAVEGRHTGDGYECRWVLALSFNRRFGRTGNGVVMWASRRYLALPLSEWTCR
jgi:hypothetical protein